ncbi:hypothetical protein [Paraburkholderia antibiotica]|uniref:hypothetical protein n=1 Tax=Paraburkholderia antibiotica TaxID=2728839 RepID=UPI00197F15C5|nr:hypothetical protein [Paraburkholderia antibiotica]
MPIIRFDHSLKSKFFEAEGRWQRSLPKAPGQIGETIVSTVEHPPVGTSMVFEVDQRFADFLSTDGFPFEGA